MKRRGKEYFKTGDSKILKSTIFLPISLYIWSDRKTVQAENARTDGKR
jgi:hypothetical protein